MSSLPPLPPLVGPYPVRRLVAHGGQSVVYEVTDPETGAALAAKVLLDGSAAGRFRREYQALVRVNHPNVVRVFRSGVTDDGLPYLVMELLEGRTAQAQVKAFGRPGSPARTDEAVRVAHGVADALAYLHGLGIIHRDLKAANVIVLPDGRVKVLDFGAVRMIAADVAPSDGREFVGTFHYAAPEQILGQPVDGRTDLYALGVLFYRMLSARRPFEGDDPVKVARLHLETPPPPLQRLVPGAPPAVLALVGELLQKDPARRPTSAAEVAARLAPLLPGAVAPEADEAVERPRRPAEAAIAAVLDAEGFAALLFEGAEGTGRRRMVRRAREEAERRGFAVVDVDLLGGPLPWVGFAERARARIPAGHPAGEALDRLAVRDRHDPADLAAVLAACAVEGPVVVAVNGLDDGAPADVATVAGAAARLAAAGAAVRLFAAVPPGGAAEAGWAGRHLTLPLTPGEVVEVARQALGVAAIAPELARRLVEASGGRIARLESLLRALPPGRGGAATRLAVPADVATRMSLELELLDAGDRRVAEMLALAGGTATASTLARALGVAPAEVEGAAQRLVAAGLVDRLADRRVRYAAGVEAEAVRVHLRPVRGALHAHRLAVVPGAVGGDEEPGPMAARAEVQLLRRSGQLAEAVALAVRRAGALVARGRWGEAEELLLPLTQARPAPTGFELWRLYAEVVAELDPDSARAEHALQRLTRLAVSDRELGDVERAAARLAMARGLAGEGAVHLERARGRYLRAGHHEGRLAVARTLAELFLSQGRVEAAAGEVLAVQEEVGGRAPRLLSTLAGAQLAAGELTEAESQLRALVGTLEQGGRGAWLEHVRRQRALRLSGRWSEARRALAEVLPRARVEATAGSLAALLVSAAELQLALGRPEAARERVAEAMAVLDGPPPSWLDEPLARVRARTAEALGEGGAMLWVSVALDRALAGGRDPAAARLQVMRGFLLKKTGKLGSGEADLVAGTGTLRRAGVWTGLAEAVTERPDPALLVDPAALYAGLDPWLAEESPPPVLLDRALLTAAWAIRRGSAVEADAARRDALRAAEALRTRLDPADRDAWTRHPLWEAVFG